MRSTALATFVLLALTTPLDAQRGLSGVVHDSLRAQGPVAGAEVVLLGAGLRTRTDSLGRFSFASVPESAHGVAYWAPWLDSLGLPPLRASLDDSTVVLATPSRATFQRTHCGTVLDGEQAVLVGEVRDADGSPRADALVLAEWLETTIGRGGIARQAMATVDTTGASGSYALCGVPHGSSVRLQAATVGQATGTLILPIESHEQRVDLVVGSTQPTVRVKGRVVESTGDSLVGVPDASLAVTGDSVTIARSAASGVFEIGLPMRSSHLAVRSIGFRPRDILLTPTDGPLELGEIVLERVPPQLDTVAVVADMYAHERAGFERRRTLGAGRYITEEQLKRYTLITAAVMNTLVPSLRWSGRGGMYANLMLRSGSGWCAPRFFEDGLDMGLLDKPPEQHNLLQRAKRIEVYTAAQAPPQFTDFDGCGAVVVWTR